MLALMLLVAATSTSARQTTAPAAWAQWGGPSRNFVVADAGLAESWPEAGPKVIWSRALGNGHSAITAADGRLFTLYRVGNPRGRQGPWDAEEIVVAMDAATGKTLWEHKYPSRRQDFSFGAGPHATPLVVGDRVFTVGTNQELFAFDVATGKVLWSHDFIKDFNSPELLLRPNVKTGYGCSPIAFEDTIICSVGGPGQSVMAFRQRDGAVVWKSGDFLTSAAAPIVITIGGATHLVMLGGGAVHGLDPRTGRILWSHPHDPGNDLNCTTPLWGDDNVLVLSSAYKAGSRALEIRPDGAVTRVSERWFTNRVRFMFLSAVRVGDFVYGTTGDFGPAFLTALDVRTGQAAWQHRGFSRASLVQAGDKTIVLDEDGDLALTRLTPQGATVLAQAKIFDTMSWSAPTLVGTTLYARDREKIVALDLGRSGAPSPPGTAPPVSTAKAAGRVSTEKPGTARLEGTWRLDDAASRVDTGAGLAGVATAGAPVTLHITQAANGSVIVESARNESQSRFYVAGAATSTPVPGGTIDMTSTIGDRLTAEGTTSDAKGARLPVTEVFAVNAARDTLTIDVTVAGRTSQFVYRRITDVGPCEQWSTPCKR